MLLAAAVAAALTTVALDDVLMVLLVAIAHMLALATRSRAYPHHPVAAPVPGDVADEPRQHSRGGAHRLRKVY